MFSSSRQLCYTCPFFRAVGLNSLDEAAVFAMVNLNSRQPPVLNMAGRWE
jgi:hypothetical protein